MRRYSNNLAFVDMFMNMLVGVTALCLLAFILINPIAKTGIVTPPDKLIIELTWDDNSEKDMDLYTRGPVGNTVYYGNKNNGYVTLRKDDLGNSTETYHVNGVPVIIRRNYEVITLNDLPAGDYMVNVHNFASAKGAEEVTVRVTGLVPFKLVFEGTAMLDARQETTLVVFSVDSEGKIYNVRTDIQGKLRKRGSAP